jgi:hypothetical protein
MLRRITVSLTVAEREGLDQLTKRDLRSPDDQLRWLLREELRRQGLTSNPDATAGQNAAHDDPAQDLRPAVLAAQPQMIAPLGTEQPMGTLE